MVIADTLYALKKRPSNLKSLAVDRTTFFVLCQRLWSLTRICEFLVKLQKKIFYLRRFISVSNMDDVGTAMI